MTNWEYVQRLLDTINNLTRIIQVQATVMEMHGVTIEKVYPVERSYTETDTAIEPDTVTSED